MLPPSSRSVLGPAANAGHWPMLPSFVLVRRFAFASMYAVAWILLSICAPLSLAAGAGFRRVANVPTRPFFPWGPVTTLLFPLFFVAIRETILFVAGPSAKSHCRPRSLTDREISTFPSFEHTQRFSFVPCSMCDYAIVGEGLWLRLRLICQISTRKKRYSNQTAIFSYYCR